MKKLILFAAVFVFAMQNLALGQSDSPEIKTGLTKLASILTDHMVEKAYLHFDRPYPCYVAGETIYFKAYVTKGEMHEPTNISNVLHVDLIDKNDILLKTLTLQINNGLAWGDFTLPDTLHKGSYRVRAYTQWMRNDSNPYFFDQFVSVSSITGVDRVADITKPTTPPNLQFFPEGGNLVADIHSKVGFKAVGTNGMGVNLKGVIVDNENKEVAKITSSHLGMGVFDFTPEAGRNYSAKVTFADGTQNTVALPAAETKGITLLVNSDDPAKLSVEIRANRAYYKENLNKELNIVIYAAGGVRTVKTKLDNSDLGFDLPANTFATGIVQVTLLSQNGEPLNERLSFVQNPDLLNLSLSTNKTSFGKRENVALSLNAKSKDGKGLAGSFSVSVIDESKILVDEDAENSILSYLLLTSNLKGNIEKPNYYFAHVSKDTRADLDALMLTQGYRRFTWKELLNGNQVAAAPTFVPEHGIDISGSLKTKTGEPIANCNIAFLAQAGGPVFSQVTDANGKFRFENAVFETGTRFILKTLSPAGKNAVLTLDKPSEGAPISTRNPIDVKYNANADILASMQNDQKFGAISESNGATTSVISKSQQVTDGKKTGAYRSSSVGGSGHADQVITSEELKGSTSLSQALNGVAHGVQFVNGVPALTSAVTVSAGGILKEQMLVVVDGTSYPSNVGIDQILPNSVETIEILKYSNAGVYGVQGGAGVMVITTKQAGATGTAVVSKQMSPGIFLVEPKGYYKVKEFYSPVYDASQAASTLPDTRTTIYWKPDVTTDADGNATLNYYNADGTGNYRVVVEGMDAKGNLGRQVIKYKVQ